MAWTESQQVDDAFRLFEKRRRAERARQWARSPKKIANVMSQVLAREGYGRMRSNEALTEAWRKAAGETFFRQTRLGKLRRGVLEVFVGNSTLMQELTFEHARILEKLKELQPDQEIRKFRFRNGPLA